MCGLVERCQGMKLRAELFSLACHVLTPFLFVHDDLRVCLLSPSSPLPAGSEPPGGFGSLRGEGPLFSPEGRRRHLRDLVRPPDPPSCDEKGRWHRIDLRQVQSWVDDSIAWEASPARALRAWAAFAYLHRRYAFALKPSKCFFGFQQTFGGLVMDGTTGALYLPEVKCKRYSTLLDPVVRGKPISHKGWQRIVGSTTWVAQVFPFGAKFLAHFFTAMNTSCEATRPAPPTAAAQRDAVFWQAALKSVPRSMATFAATNTDDPASWDVVVHTDWCPLPGGEQVLAVYVLSHGLYSAVHAPSWFLELYPDAGSPFPSSPTFEALTLYAYLQIFPDIAQGSTSAFFNDNVPWLLRTSSFSSPTPSVDAALRLGALAAMQLNARIIPLHVPTTHSLADPVSHSNHQALARRCTLLGLSAPVWRDPPSLPEPPSLPGLRPSS